MSFEKLIKKSFWGWDINQIDYKKPTCAYCGKIATYTIRFCFGLLGRRLFCEDCKNQFIREHDKTEECFFRGR